MAVESQFSKRLIHIGIVVRDMDKAVQRLESLGIGPFKLFDPNSMPTPTEKSFYRGKPFDPDCKTYIAKVGEIEIELFEPSESESPWKDFLDAKGEGIHHIAFREHDLENEVARLTEQGTKTVLRGKWQGGGFTYLDLGAGDIIIELEQK